jgi:hypothetical protein
MGVIPRTVIDSYISHKEVDPASLALEAIKNQQHPHGERTYSQFTRLPRELCDMIWEPI